MNQSTSPQPLSKQSFQEFANAYPTYEKELTITYRVYCDIMIRNEYSSVEIVDGAQYGIDCYIFKATTINKNIHRILIPCNVEGEIDLFWCVQLQF